MKAGVTTPSIVIFRWMLWPRTASRCHERARDAHEGRICNGDGPNMRRNVRG